MLMRAGRRFQVKLLPKLRTGLSGCGGRAGLGHGLQQMNSQCRTRRQMGAAAPARAHWLVLFLLLQPARLAKLVPSHLPQKAILPKPSAAFQQ
jgi:hypothetical protein